MDILKPTEPQDLLAHVLVVEDNPDFAQVFGELLQAMGCSVCIESDARRALLAAQSGKYHVIFCDIALPGELSGLDFARAIRQDEKLANSFLVSISGFTSLPDRERAVIAGFDRVLSKPVELKDIEEVFETTLKHRHLMDK